MDRVLNEIKEVFKVSHEEDVKISGKECSSLNLNSFINLEGRFSGSDIAFIDGGNQELISSPVFSLQFIRTAAIIFSGNRRKKTIKEETYCSTKIERENDKLKFICKVFPKKDEPYVLMRIAIHDNKILESNKVPSISRIGEIARRILELNLALSILSKIKNGSMIVLDGSLNTNINEEQTAFKKLSDLAEESGVLLTGLVKTNRLFSEAGADVLTHARKKAPEMAWMLPIQSNNDLEILLVKLHERSEHIFRFELLKKQAKVTDIRKVAGILVANSKDPIFFGYPYGLILADKSARVQNSEISYLKTRIMAKLGLDSEKLQSLLTSINAHEILDSLS